MSTKPNDDGTTPIDDGGPNISRRRFGQMAAAGAAVAVGAGTVSAQASQLDYSSGYVPNPTITGSVSVAEHDHSSMSSPLEYVDDEGNSATLADFGGSVAPREDSETPHNPVTLNAAKIRADDYSRFPGGETYENDDGDEVDLNAIDATHWSTDASGSSGSISVEDATTAADGSGLRISTTGQTSGDTAVATFSDAEISSGVRKYLQLVLDVDTLDSGTVVEIRATDAEDNSAIATVDSSADSASDGTLATSTGDAIVYQCQLGTLQDPLGTIQSLEVEVAEGNADLHFAGINLEKESRWSFGAEEFVNSNDEIDERTIYEPSGDQSINSLGSLGGTFDEAVLVDLEVDIELELSGATHDGAVDYEITDAGRYSFDSRFRMAANLWVPTAYDLDWGTLEAVDEVVHPSDRWLEVATDNALTDPVDLADVDDSESWGTDSTATYEGAALNDEVTVSTAVSPGQYIGIFYDVLLTSDEASDAESSGGSVAGGPIGGGSSSFMGIGLGPIMGLFTGVGLIVAKIKGWVPYVG